MGTMDKKMQGAFGPYGYGNQYTMKSSAKSSDGSGERGEKMRGGVAMGAKDACGADNQFNTGRTKGVCYTHERAAYK